MITAINLSTILLIFLFTIAAWAAGPQSDLELGQLTELNFEDLAKIKISVASKQRTQKSDVPGFVTVYSAAEIKALGYYTLADLANITPGFTSMYKFVGKQSFTVRGQRVPGNNFDNNKVLVLVDGIPMNHLRDGRAPINEELTMDGIERVEFLKGPASALYGTGAFFGVINVISKKMKEIGTSIEGRLTYGSYNTTQSNASAFFNTDNVRGKAIATYSQKESMALPWGDNSDDHRRSVDNLNALSLNTSLTFKKDALKNFAIGFINNANRSGTWNNTLDLPPQTEADTGYYYFQTRTAYLKYRKEISDRFSLNSYIRRGWSTEESRSFRYRQNFTNVEFLAEGRYKLSDKSNLIFGVDYDQRQREGRNHGTYQNTGNVSQDNYVKSKSNPLKTYSAYAQYCDRFPILKGLLTTVGFRYDDAFVHEGPITINVGQLSPRIALIQKLTNEFSLKFLYGRAFRSPDLKALGVANEALQTVTNPQLPDRYASLGAEKISSYEFGLSYEGRKVSTTLAAFYTVVQDQLGRETVDLTPTDPTDSDQGLYVNKNGNSIGRGLEYEFNYAFDKTDVLNFNAAWNLAYLPNNPVDRRGKFGGVPSYTSSVRYIKKWDKFSGSIVGYYIGKRRTDKGVSDPQKGFFLIDANLSYAINLNTDVALWLRNIGNQDWRYSATGTQDTLAERGYARSIYTTINFRF